MSVSEFDIIDQYFKPKLSRSDVTVGVGDDCAVLDVPAGSQLVSTIDTLISGIHFPADTSAQDIVCKSIAVNLSDLAAMGATPSWMSLAISLPVVDAHWLEQFSTALHSALAKYEVELIGGDTTKGDLSISIHAMGFVEKGKAMLRSNAKPGDLIYVSGYLGDAALGLAIHQKKINAVEDADYFLQRLNRPVARVALGQHLKEFCSCAIDISDGLFSDLNHILKSSGCGARINTDRLPLSAPARQLLAIDNINIKPHELMSGDDYELCFTVPEKNIEHIQAISKQLDIALSCIGSIDDSKQLICFDGESNLVDITKSGFNHFIR